MDMIDIVETSSASGFPGSPNGWSNVVTRSIEYIADFPDIFLCCHLLDLISNSTLLPAALWLI